MSNKEKHPIFLFIDLSEGAKQPIFELHDEIEQTIIPKIPSIDKNRKSEFIDDVNSNINCKTLFLKYNLVVNFTPDFFQEIPDDLLNSKYSISIQTLIFSFQCFTWAFDDNHTKTTNELDTLIQYFINLESSVGKLSVLSEYALNEVLCSTLTDDKFHLNEESALVINKLFIDSKTLTKRISNFFTDFVAEASEISETVSKAVLGTLITVTSEKRQFIISCNFSDLMRPLNKYVNKLDPCGLMVVGYSTYFAPSDLLNFIFQSLPMVLYMKISVNRDSNVKKDYHFKEFPQSVNQDEFNFTFFNQNFSLPKHHNFVLSDSFTFSNTYLIDACSSITNCLVVCKNEFRDTFFASSLKVIKSSDLPNLQTFSCLLSIIIKNLSITYPVPSAYSVLVESLVVRSKQNIFEYIHSDIDYARTLLFELLSKNESELIIDLFERFSTSPFLIAEFIVRFHKSDVSNVNVGLFINEGFLSAIINAIHQLRDEELARSIVFNFLIYITNNENSSYLCFKSQTFAKGFFIYLFDRDISENIISLTRNRFCSFDSPNGLTPSISMINNILDFSINSKDEEYCLLSRRIFDMISKILMHKPVFMKMFMHYFDKYLTFCTQQNSLSGILEFLSILCEANSEYTLNTNQAQILVNLVHSLEGKEPSRETFEIMSKCINRNSFFDKAFLPIVNTKIVPLCFAIFGFSERLDTIFKAFLSMIKFWPSSVTLLHESGVDSIVMQYFSQENDCGDIILDQYNFCMQIPKKAYESCFALMKKIVVEVCDHNILALFTQSLQSKFSLLTSRLLEECFAYSFTIPSPLFGIGYLPKQFSVVNIPKEIFHEPFSVTFSLDADFQTMICNEGNFVIFSVTDVNGNEMCLFFNRGQLFASFENTYVTNTVLLSRTAHTGVWIDYVFAFKMESETMMKIMKYSDSTISNSGELRFDGFDGQNVTLSVGGYSKTTEPSNLVLGKIHNFCLYNCYFESFNDTSHKPFFSSNIITPRESAQTEIELPGFHSQHKSSSVPPTLNVFRRSIPPTILQLSIECTYPRILTALFESNGVQDISIVLSILKEIVPLCPNFLDFDPINSYFSNRNPSLINFSLFKTFTQILESLEGEQQNRWLEVIVGDLTMWSKAKQFDFELIMQTFANFLSRVYSFTPLPYLNFYMSVFNPMIKGSLVNRTRTKRFFLKFLHRILRINAEECDITFLINCIIANQYQFSLGNSAPRSPSSGLSSPVLQRRFGSYDSLTSIDSMDTLILELQTMLIQRPEILKSIRDKEKTLCDFCSFFSPNISITLNYVVLIQLIVRDSPFSYSLLMQCYHQIVDNVQNIDLFFRRLFDLLYDFPTFISLIILIAMNLKEEKISLSASTLADISQNCTKREMIFRDQFWYLLPVLLSTHVVDTDVLNICQFLIEMVKLNDSAKQNKLLIDIFTLISIIGLTVQNTKSSLNLLKYKLMELVLTEIKTVSESVIKLLFCCTFFQMNTSPFQEHFLSLFKESIFCDESTKNRNGFVSTNILFHPISTFDEFVAFIGYPFSTLTFNFKLLLDHDVQWMHSNESKLLLKLTEFAEFESETHRNIISSIIMFFVNKKAIESEKLPATFAILDTFIENLKTSYRNKVTEFTTLLSREIQGQFIEYSNLY